MTIDRCNRAHFFRRLRPLVALLFVAAAAGAAWAADDDSDGISNADETSIWGTDPNDDTVGSDEYVSGLRL